MITANVQISKSYMNTFIATLPKAELHVHLIGTLEPHLFLKIAKRNNIETAYNTLPAIKDALRDFGSLTTFLEIYYQVAHVLQTEQDFYETTLAYLKKAGQQGVLHAEFFFEAQSYMRNGITFETIITGITHGIKDAHKKYGISALPILCFLRNLSEEYALEILEASLPFKDKIVAIGLASNEKDHPPSKFVNLFAQAKKHGYKLCAHAGEDVGPDYIWQAIKLLHIDRIDHGIRCIEDKDLIAYLQKTYLPITVCPLSNLRLNIYKEKEYPLLQLMHDKLNISINSDDPVFFGGYINENYAQAHKLGLSREQLVQCARNSMRSSFVLQEHKEHMMHKLDKWLKYH